MAADNADITPSQLEFAIFSIESVAARLDVPGDVVYRALSDESDILSSYIIPFYDVLHTQSKDYIVDDILRVMDEDGVRP